MKHSKLLRVVLVIAQIVIIAAALLLLAACGTEPATHPWAGNYALTAIADVPLGPGERGYIALSADGTFVDVFEAPAVGFVTPDTLRGTWSARPGDSLYVNYAATGRGFLVAWRDGAFTLRWLGVDWRYER